MDLTEEIDQMERAKALLKDERASHKNEILKAINPLHVISRVSQRSVSRRPSRIIVESLVG